MQATAALAERRAALLRAYPALTNPHFRIIWLGMLPATIAWQLSVVAAPYAAFRLEGTATVLGIVSLATGLPQMLFSLVGGVAADRLPRRRTLLITQSTLCLASGVIAALALADVLAVWHLIAYGVVQGIAFAFNMPTRQAFLAEIVGPAQVRSAVALNSVGMNFSRVSGPALGGVLLSISSIGVGGVFMVMTLMYAGVLASIFHLPESNPLATAAGKVRRAAGGWAQLLEGLRYVVSTPAVRVLLSMGFLGLFFGMPFQTLMPLFSERIFDAGAAGLGILMSAIGVGALIGSLSAAVVAQGPRPAVLQLWSGIGFGAALVVFAFTPSLPWAVVVLVAVGALSSAYSTLNYTLVMSNADPRLYGRVMSIQLLTFATQPLGAMPLAWLADAFNGRLAVAVAGLAVGSAVAGVAMLYPAYRSIR